MLRKYAVYTFALSCFSFNALAQNLPFRNLREKNDYIENHFISEVKQTDIITSHGTYKSDSVDQAIDTLLKLNIDFPLQQLIDNSVDYNREPFSRQFNRILTTIDNFLPSINDTAFLNDSILNPIKLLKTFKEKTFALQHLSYHLRPYKSVFRGYSERINRSVILVTKTEEDMFTYNIAFANYGRGQDLPAALATFEQAYDYYSTSNNKVELAELDNNMADLYSMRNQYEYIRKCLDHLQRAGENYLSLHYDYYVLKTRIRLGIETVKILDSSRIANPEDVIKYKHTILVGGMLRKSHSNEIDSFFSIREDNIRNEIFRDIIEIEKYIERHKEYDNLFGNWKYLILGDYFMKIEKYYAAVRCYNIALFKGQHLNDLYESLSRLSEYYKVTKNYVVALKLINAAILIAGKQKDYLFLCDFYNKKGEIMNSYGNYADAVSNFKHCMSVCDSLNMEMVPMSNQNLVAYSGLGSAYIGLRKVDSSILYKERYSDLRLQFINELDRLNNIEYDFDFRRKNRILAKREKDISWANTLIYGLLSFIALGFVLFWITVVLKNRIAKKVRIELNGIAVSKHHNLKSNFTVTNILLLKKQFEVALNYTNASSEYYNSLIDLEDLKNNKWTLAQERKILEAFSSKEKIHRNNFNLFFEPGSLNIEKILFIPEIFTTLLDNSIKHGFDPKKKGYYFKIDVSKKGRFLYFEISDNGKFAGIQNYLRKETPNKGLNFLRRRIKNELSNKIRLKKRTDFVIEENRDKGTTIKFTYPYAVSS